MSLEAWGDDGLEGPDGYVTDEVYEEAQAEIERLTEENASNKRVIEALGCQIKFERTKQCTQRFCSTRTVPSPERKDQADG